ncbi:MAG: hypothetical protein ACLGI3_08225, partial [Actinomycetes bacterium]
MRLEGARARALAAALLLALGGVLAGDGAARLAIGARTVPGRVTLVEAGVGAAARILAGVGGVLVGHAVSVLMAGDGVEAASVGV